MQKMNMLPCAFVCLFACMREFVCVCLSRIPVTRSISAYAKYICIYIYIYTMRQLVDFGLAIPLAPEGPPAVQDPDTPAAAAAAAAAEGLRYRYRRREHGRRQRRGWTRE